MSDLKAWRDCYSMTQQQAADAVGVSYSLWRAIEAGTREASLTLTLALKGYDAEQGALAPTSATNDEVAEHGAIADLQARLALLEELSIEARLNAMARPAPDSRQEQFEREARAIRDAGPATDYATLAERRLAELAKETAEEEAAEAAGDQPWNTYRPPQLTPAEEAAKRAKAAAAKAAHLATGEPWD